MIKSILGNLEKGLEVKVMYNNIEDIENIDVIKWAFKKGYDLGTNDIKEDVHISFAETQKFFLDELAKFYAQENQVKYVCT
ncbi:hypothetical protein [Aliikangiella coralliicola]|uniref:Uncharacterized protein n=1 Tax=Aliikangiella coralliicola TaxID=2592383 RepID=A0A545U4B2_9GAMM|nr:hypothetical protein [Aliikangiella coralliicola]TQV84327.1 hypothetical protein FLL46_22130 [Aliikangiella coralliicola]